LLIEVRLKSSQRRKISRQTTSGRRDSGSARNAAGLAAHPLLPIALLVLLCLVVYYNSLSNGFVYDDFGSIVENKYISEPGRFLTSIFNRSYFQIAGLEASYRPVATLSYFLIYAVAKLNPFYYHLASLILHALNAVLVYWLANLVLQHRLRALAAGLLFACHPALSEAVNCIDFNDDLLATLFFLLAMISWVRIKTAHLSSSIRIYLPALLFYFLGLLSKEMAITLPAVIMLYDLVLRDAGRDAPDFRRRLTVLRERLYFYAGFISVGLIYLGLRFFIFYSPRESLKTSAGSLFERLIYLPGHIFSFIRLALFPVNLNADYVFSYPTRFFDFQNLIGTAVVIVLVVVTFLIYRYSKEIFFGIWWFLITLFPVYNLIEIYNPLAERYLYLPLIGFCLVVPAVVHGLAVGIISNPKTAKAAALIPIVALIGLYSTATIARNPDWKSNFVLWSQTVKRSPDSLTAHGGLGMAYLERGMLDEAAKQFEIAIKLYPDHAKSYYNLGLVYYQKGDQKKAVEYFKRCAALEPESMRAHYNLATIYLKQGLWDRAIYHYAKVNELDPEITMAHYNLGMAYAMQGSLNQAIAEWQIVMQLDPQNPQAGKNIEKARMMLNRAGGHKRTE
jgi:tetratricopeptide (TPR) repeat protein